MKTVALTIRGCPEDLRDSLKACAERHNRSMGQEVLSYIREKVEEFQVSPSKNISEAELLALIKRNKITTHLTPEEQDRLRKEGRA